MQNYKIVDYKGIKLMDEINTRPHADSKISGHDSEYQLFDEVLEKISNKKNPTMVEIGCWWAFWSLCFRKKYPEGKNILIELGKRHLSIGINNFKLNQFSETHYWGGFFLGDSNTYFDVESNYNFPKLPNEYFDDSLIGKMTGPELDFIDVYSIEKLDKIDLLHMDIQGSELPLLEDISKNYEFLLKDKIENIVVATHSTDIHEKLSQIFLNHGFKFMKDMKWPSVGGDGMLIVTKN